MKHKIGQVVTIDKAGQDQARHFWENGIFPRLNKIIEEYKLLGIGKFSQEDYENIIAGKSFLLEDRFKNKVTEETEKLGKSIARTLVNPESTDKALKSFRQAVVEINQFISLALQNQLSTPKFDYNDCKIHYGRPTLQEEYFTNRFKVVIESEIEAEFMDRLQQLKIAYDNLGQFMNENGIPSYINIVSETTGFNNALTFEGEDRKLEIDPKNIFLIRN